jgi:crossover junction endodeoxyribonuclease RusA
MTKASAVRVARSTAYYIARSKMPQGTNWPAECQLRIEFCPPDRRKRDMDNMLASAKGHLDGLADAMRIDDSGWTLVLTRGQPEAGGAVYITIEGEIS